MINIPFLKYDLQSSYANFERKWIHSLLSVMGIMIFIISIIIIISVSQGAKEQALENIRNLGINTIRIHNKPFSNISNQNKNRSAGLTHQNYKLIEKIVSKYGFNAMVINKKNSSVFFKNGDTTVSILGSNEKFLLVEDLKILKGRPLLKKDIQNSNFHAIVSKDIAFKYNLTINQNIVYNTMTYTITGISDIKDNRKNFILVPYNTIKFSEQVYDQINIYIYEESNIPLLANILKNKINNENFNMKNFIINIPMEIIEKERETQSTFNVVLIIIAILSLLTGGISVMNAVLSNINEQTREIGLKMAIGATKNRIIRYYLLYTSLLTFIGGIIGGVIGYLTLFIIYLTSNLPIVFSLEPFILGLFIAIISGVVFGIYPALRAANIKPIIALKEF